MSGRRKNNSQPTAGTVKHHQITKFVGINIEKTEKVGQNNSSAKGQFKTITKATTQALVQKVNLRKTKELPTKECDPTPLAQTQIVTINPKRSKQST